MSLRGVSPRPVEEGQHDGAGGAADHKGAFRES